MIIKTHWINWEVRIAKSSWHVKHSCTRSIFLLIAVHVCWIVSRSLSGQSWSFAIENLAQATGPSSQVVLHVTNCLWQGVNRIIVMVWIRYEPTAKVVIGLSRNHRYRLDHFCLACIWLLRSIIFGLRASCGFFAFLAALFVIGLRILKNGVHMPIVVNDLLFVIVLER